MSTHQSLRFGLDIRCLRTRVPQRACFINLRFKVGRFLDQGGSKLRVGGCLGEVEKCRGLTHEIIPAYHVVPRFTVQPRASRGSRDFVPAEMYKNELKELCPEVLLEAHVRKRLDSIAA